ncbi:MAG: hypothetical protein SGJ18_15245 [Pseudomonadota bacterium]|nr:hypothetical protein [Pseudomonadota bacterium]
MTIEARINANKILDKLSLEEDREKVSLYLSRSLYERFKKVCGSAPASRVMEELMKSFMEDLSKTRKGGKA